MVIFEEQQQNISTPIEPMWKPLTKSWKNCCLNQWMPNSFRNPERVSTIWVKNLNKNVNKINNKKSLMTDMKPRDAIKLNTIQLDKTYPEETVLPEDGLSRYLCQPREQHGDQKRRAKDFFWSKNAYRVD